MSQDTSPEDKYLLNYFSSGIQRAFLCYYLVFRDHELFTDHTGIYCTDRWVKLMRDRFQKLTAARKLARETFDIETLAALENGTFKAGRNKGNS